MITALAIISIIVTCSVALCAFSKPAKAIRLDVAMQDSTLFGPWFKGESWGAWVTIAKVMVGVVLSELEQQIYGYIAVRETVPSEIKQLWICAGRRSGKSIFSAFLAVYYAVFRDWSSVLTRGETGIVGVICPDRGQGKIIFNYAKAFCEYIPMLHRLVDRITAECIIFKNGIRLEIKTASYRTPRGFSIVCLIVDEACFLRDEDSANPFNEILIAAKPSMATTHGLLIVISTPYSRSGEFYKAHERYFGQEHPSILFLKAPTAFMNPSVDASVIESAFAEDAAAARSEFGDLAQGISFRSDLESFVDLEVVQSLVEKGRYEAVPDPAAAYVGGWDQAGGGGESTAGAIARKLPDGMIELCSVREWKGKHSPAGAIGEGAEWFKQWGISRITADRYAGQFPVDEFKKFGIEVEPAPMPKSDYFLALLPLLNSKRVKLLDSDRLVGQLVDLERKTRSGGKDSVDHGPSGKDDVANSVAIAIITAATKWIRPPNYQGWCFC